MYPPETDTTRLVTDSACFLGVRYEIKDEHLIIWTRESGVLAIKLDKVKHLVGEVAEVADMWKGVRT